MQFVNEPFLRLFGYRKGELEGRWAPVCWVVQHDCICQSFASKAELTTADWQGRAVEVYWGACNPLLDLLRVHACADMSGASHLPSAVLPTVPLPDLC